MTYRGDGIPGTRKDLLVTALSKGEELYVVSYDDTDEGAREVFKQISQWAANPELSFNWYDAAIFSRRIRKQRSEIRKRER